MATSDVAECSGLRASVGARECRSTTSQLAIGDIGRGSAAAATTAANETLVVKATKMRCAFTEELVEKWTQEGISTPTMGGASSRRALEGPGGMNPAPRLRFPVGW